MLVTTQGTQKNASGLWRICILGGVPRKLADSAGEASVSPDGARIAFVSGPGNELWVMGSDCRQPLCAMAAHDEDTLHSLAWVGNTKRLFFARLHPAAYRFDVNIESIDLETGKTTTVLSDPGLRGMATSPDGRLVYSLAEPPPNQNTCGLWQTQVDVGSGKILGKPRRMKNWAGSSLYGLSLTAGGKRLAFLKGSYQADVYIGELEENGRHLKNPRRLTLDDANDLPTAWADNETVLFHSDRNGKWEVFKQKLGERMPSVAVTDQEDDKGARITPEGALILYFARPKYRVWSWAEPTRLIAVPLSGGPSRLLLNQHGLYSVRCSRRSANLCVLLGERGLTGLTFYVLDPVEGKGRELMRTPVRLALDQDDWDVSPDGTKIAIALADKPYGHVRVLALSGDRVEDLIINEHSGFQSMDWSADGSGVYVSSPTAWGADLLYVDLQGHVEILRHQIGSFASWGVPSPDGKHLAFLEWTGSGNVWMAEEF